MYINYNYCTMNISQFNKFKKLDGYINNWLKGKIAAENRLNDAVMKIAVHGKHHGYKVLSLTETDGDCFFRSMVDLGYGKDVKSLKKGIAALMHTYKDYKGFFPTQKDISLKELFKLTNEIEKVKIKDSVRGDSITDYTFEVMCCDLATKGEWTRLPTELIMNVMSYIFKIQFVIFRNEGNNKIVRKWADDIEYADEICLGHVMSFHYIPMIKSEDISLINTPTYQKYENKLDQAVKFMYDL